MSTRDNIPTNGDPVDRRLVDDLDQHGAQNENGSAPAATGPSHGSTIPAKDTAMNTTMHSAFDPDAASGSATRRPARPNDARLNAALAEAFREMESSINEPRVASKVTLLLGRRQLEQFETLNDGRRVVVIDNDDAEALLWMLHEVNDKIEAMIGKWSANFDSAHGKEIKRVAA